MSFRKLRKIVLWSASTLGLLVAGGIMVYANPGPFFPYQRSYGSLTLFDQNPIPPSADIALGGIQDRLNESPFATDQPLSLYVTGNGWRRELFFRFAPGAGGVAYYPIAPSHAFLSGADYNSGRLIKGEQVIGPPRTLVYYGTHELVHVLMGQILGAFRFHTMPEWLREGIPDYVALGPVTDIPAMDHILGDGAITLESMRSYGVYIRYRMLVTWYLDQGLSWDQLMALDVTEAEALAIMREGDTG